MFLNRSRLLSCQTSGIKPKPPLFPLGEGRFHLIYTDSGPAFRVRKGKTRVGNQPWIMRKEHKVYAGDDSTDEHHVLKIVGTKCKGRQYKRMYAVERNCGSYGLGSDPDDSVLPWLILHRFIFCYVDGDSCGDDFEIIARESEDAKEIKVEVSFCDNGWYHGRESEKFETRNLEQKEEVKKVIHDFAAKEEMTASEFVDALPEEFRGFAKTIIE